MCLTLTGLNEPWQNHCNFPGKLKQGVIHLISKGGSRADTEYESPISLTPLISNAKEDRFVRKKVIRTLKKANMTFILEEVS